MKKYVLLAMPLLMVLAPSCNKSQLAVTPEAQTEIIKRLKVNDLQTPTSIYLGGAFRMNTMAYPGAALWSTDAAYGVGLHVHPVGWRGQFAALGPPISANLVNKTFTYEMDIVDPRNGVNNISEVETVQGYGLTCVRVTCNVDAAELDTNPNLPTELLNSVVIPFNNIGIAVDILFSPVSPTALQAYQGSTHIQRLIDNSRWTTLVFNGAHAQGVALDIPPNYYRSNSANINTILQQAKTSGHEVTWVANCSPNDNINLVDNLSTILSTTRGLNIAPTRWICDQFSAPDSAPVPEMNSDGSPQETPAGGALFLARNTLSSSSVTEQFYPDITQYYKLTSAQTGKCLDVSGVSTANGAQVWIWDYVNGTNQQWRFVATANGYYKIISQNSGKCLAAATTANSNGTNIVQLADNNGANEQWKIVYVGNGFKFVNLGTGKAIIVQAGGTANGTLVIENDFTGGTSQQWYFTATGHI